MRFEIDFDKPSISWFAKRDIQKDEECVFDYDVKLWFNPVE
jgi:SET domain-containing protein